MNGSTLTLSLVGALAVGAALGRRGSRATDPTSTPAFCRWFGDSKVVDAVGRPLVVYHGTNHAFDAFDMDRLGASVDNPTTLFGFFFTQDPEDAASWAERAVLQRRASPAQAVLPVYLSLQKPKKISAAKFRTYLRSASEATILRDLHTWKAAGHDGIVTEREGKAWYVAFRPEQIKSATGNRGTYDPEDPRISYNRGTR